MAYHLREGGERGAARKENLEELVNACRQFARNPVFPAEEGEQDSQASELDEFLDQAALLSGDHQSGGPAVQMMTMHSAKGLEFPLVFMAGMEEGLFPTSRSVNEGGRLEEERRLAYVGITRAMRQLYLTYAETRRMNGMQSHNWPSRFLDEVPAECLEEVRMGGAVSRPFRAQAGNGADDPLDERPGVRIGQMVRHAKFGDGIVLQAEGSGERTRVQVNFANAGSKWLMLAYANLEVLG